MTQESGLAIDWTAYRAEFPTLPYQWLARPECEVVILPSDDGIGVALK